MRYLIISDIHGNLEGLEAVLCAAEGRYDQAVCCGDLVGYGPDPNPVTDWVRQNVVAVVRGNHDKACCGIDGAEDFNPAARTAARWTQNRLSDENLTYLRNLPVGPVQLPDFQLVHGSVRDEDEYLFVPQDAVMDFPYLGHRLTFFGHTHRQGGFIRAATSHTRVRAVELHFREGPDSRELELDESDQYLLNPGSVGQPRDGDSRAGFVIYTSDQGCGVVEYWRVPYDIERTQRKMIDAGLPVPLADRLAFGR